MSLQPLKRELSGDLEPRPLRILQFGGGNFLRGFVGWMVEICNREAGFNGDILVVKPTRDGTYEALRTQDGLYHVWTRGIRHGQPVSDLLKIRCVREIVNPYTEWESFLHSARLETLRYVVSNTTESGIRYEPLQRPERSAPDNFPAKLTWWLYYRFRHFRGSKTSGCIILPCELIANNARVLKDYVLEYARTWELEEAFSDWLHTANYFCSTLVDRIVSGYPGKEEAEKLHREIGYTDKLLVASEPYHSWVIEISDFQENCLPETVTPLNIQIVPDLQPYREMKVRILNGAHTLMVPVGFLAGLRYVDHCMEDTQMRNFVHGLMDEICSVVPLPTEKVEAFRAETLERFRNPYLHHELLSISLNSIDKFKTRVLPTLTDYLERQEKLPEHIVFAFAALFVFYKGVCDAGAIPLRDSPEVLQAFSRAWEACDGSRERTERLCFSLLGATEFWGKDMTHTPELPARMAQMIYRIESEGLRTALVAEIA